MLKLEVDSSLEKIIVRKWTDQVVLYFTKHGHMKWKTHTMILVCAADDFRKYQKMWKMRFLKKSIFKKNLKDLSKAKLHMFVVFSSQLDGFVLPILQFNT